MGGSARERGGRGMGGRGEGREGGEGSSKD